MRAALALEALPRISAAMSRGELSKLEKVNYRRRWLPVFPDDSGMYVVRGVVTPKVGVLLMRAVEAASDGLFC